MKLLRSAGWLPPRLKRHGLQFRNSGSGSRYDRANAIEVAMVTEDRLATYEAEFRELREHLVRVLGAPTVNRLVERAAAEIARAHPGIASLRCEDDDLVFDGVRAAFAEAPEEDIRRSFAALYGVMVVIMARVLGRELAERLTEGLSIAQLSGAVSGYGRG